MNIETAGTLQLAALGAAAIVLLAAISVGGLAATDDDPTGVEVLSEVEDRYESADSVLIEAVATVQQNNSTSRLTIHAVTTADGQSRVNLSNGSAYVVTGQTGNTTWVTNGETGATLLISSTDPANRTATGIGSAPLPGVSTHTIETENGTVSISLYRPENASLDSIGQTLNGSHDVSRLNGTDRSGAWISGPYHSSGHNGSRNASHAQVFNESGPMLRTLSKTVNASDRPNQSISDVVAETNLTAAFVGTTTVDDQPAHVVDITHPEREGRLKVWAATATANVLKYQISRPNATLTVDINATRFNVSPAPSTFEPEIAAQDDRRRADSLSELREAAAVPIGIPSENWSYADGYVIASPIEAVIGHYEANGTTVTVVQSPSSRFERFTQSGRTVAVNARNVTLTELADEQMVAAWSQNEQTVLVTGNVTESTLLEFVRSLEFDS